MRQIHSIVVPVGIAALCIAVSLLNAAPFSAQSTPDWEKAASGKMSFDVASIKRHPYDPAAGAYYPQANFSLSEDDSYKPTGGLISTEDMPVSTYIRFAYKLNAYQDRRLAYPKWGTGRAF
jgi:hypothetical protein